MAIKDKTKDIKEAVSEPLKRFITRVKTDANYRVFIEYREGTGSKLSEMNKTSIISKERAPSVFYKALRDLGKFVPALCELGDEWEYGLTVNEVLFDFKGKDMIMGARIVATKSLKAVDSTIEVKTPMKMVRATKDIPPAMVYNKFAIQALELVQTRANEYLEGAREQQQLFDGEKKPVLAPINGIPHVSKKVGRNQMALPVN